MPFDSITTTCIAKELNALLSEGRVDKIYMPDSYDIIMNVRARGQNRKLLLSCNASFPRVYLTDALRENPMTPPNFCMLLRKFLTGGKILSIQQYDLERIIEFAIEVRSELGDIVVKKLIVELLGKYSNILLVHENGKIADCIRHVDDTVTSMRLVLPGLPYELPPKMEKQPPFSCDKGQFFSIISEATPGKPVDKVLLENILGLSPLLSREITYRALHRTDLTVMELTNNQIYDVAAELARFFDQVKEGEFSPVLLYDGTKPVDFAPIPITQYESLYTIQTVSQLCESLDSFYLERERHNKMTTLSRDMAKTVNNLVQRCRKKMHLQEQSVQDAEKRETDKLYGDLITANIYQIAPGDRILKAINFYEEQQPEVEIKLDPTLTPSQNAQKYYARYNKLKSTAENAAQQLEKSAADLEYLESVATAISQCESTTDLREIKAELTSGGYIKNRQKAGKQKQKDTISMPTEYTSSDGFTILVGKNNKQNDFLTLKIARGNDIWFHTKNIPGSHTVIISEGQEVPETTILEAAVLAAYHSKARASSNVPVDYTQIRNVKKPGGAKPGMVIYVKNKTLYVSPDEALVLKLKKQ